MLAVAPSWVSNSSSSTRRFASWSSLASIDGFIADSERVGTKARGAGTRPMAGATAEVKKALTAAAEQLRQQAGQACALVAFGAVQRLLRTVQELGGQAFRQG